MRRTVTPRLRMYALLAALGLVGGLIAGRPELGALSAPFVILLGVGLTMSRDIDATARATLDRDRAIEGESIILHIDTNTNPRGARLEVEIDVPAGVELAAATMANASVTLANPTTFEIGYNEGQPSALRLELRCKRWGAYRIGKLVMRSRDVWGLFDYSLEESVDVAFKVFPETAALRALLRPVETQLGYGDLVSRGKGGGLEYADLRPMAVGDDRRQINWRVSARGKDLWVNDRHPERNSDVVLLVDTLFEARRGVQMTIDLAVRAAAGLAASHLRRNDRVGLISFGSSLKWLQPGMGDVQRYRILDTLMESRSHRPMYWHDVSAVPRRALPAKALIVGLSPLLDDRAIDAFADLRGRGFDLAVVEIAAETFVSEPATVEEELARRIWVLQREATRNRFLRHGIATVRWHPDEPVQHALAEVEAFRRNAMRARV